MTKGEENIVLFERDELFTQIEAQQQEIRLLSMEIAELRESNQALKTYAENADADKDEQAGRLVVLPCRVGDVVWKTKTAFSYFSKPMEDRVDRIIISNNEILVCCTGGAKFSIDDIGKTVFLTRESAEKALGGAEDGK